MPTAIPTASTPGRRVVRIGIGLDFAGKNEFMSYLATQALKTNQEILIAEAYEPWIINGFDTFAPANEDKNYYCICRPVPGLAASDIYANGPFDYGSEGIEISLTEKLTIRRGVKFTGFRINVTGSGRVGMGGGASNLDTICALSGNCIKLGGGIANVVDMGESEVPCSFDDNLVLRVSGTSKINIGSQVGSISRNTFVALNGATGTIVQAGNTQCKVENNVFHGIGPVPFTGNSPNVAGNITNIALTTARAGVAVDTVSAFFQGANDYRPAAGGALDGTATASANSINDIRGANRGLNPDVGAWQRVPATPLPTGTVTGSPKPQGQQWTIPFTTTFSPTSAMASLSPAAVNPGNAIGMSGAVTLGSGTGQAVFADITPGNYQGTITISNDGGSASVSNIPALSILEISGSPTANATEGGEVPEPTGPMVIVSWAEFDTQAPPVVVVSPIVQSVVVSPASAQVIGGGTYQFTAQAFGLNSPPQTFDWATTLGTVVDGLVTTPAVGQSLQATVTATSTFDPTQSGSVSFTIAPDPALPPNFFLSTILSADAVNLTTALL